MQYVHYKERIALVWGICRGKFVNFDLGAHCLWLLRKKCNQALHVTSRA